MNNLDRYYIAQWGIEHYVEHRLYQWAKWFKQKDYHGLGYPQQSVEARHLENGGVVDERRGPRPLPCHPAAEELENILGILRQSVPKLSNALCQEYLDQRDQGTKARKMGVSRAQFKIDVALARYWLQGWFQACLMREGASCFNKK